MGYIRLAPTMVIVHMLQLIKGRSRLTQRTVKVKFIKTQDMQYQGLCFIITVIQQLRMKKNYLGSRFLNNNRRFMKNAFLFLLLIAVASCSTSKKAVRVNAKLRILRVDSTSALYVFNCKNSLDSNIIIIAEKEKFTYCKPFKRFILSDSVKESMEIKDGASFDIIGFDGLTIDKIRVKKAGELVKIIKNCSAIID
jgi:hypothetical protein